MFFEEKQIGKLLAFFPVRCTARRVLSHHPLDQGEDGHWPDRAIYDLVLGFTGLNHDLSQTGALVPPHHDVPCRRKVHVAAEKVSDSQGLHGVASQQYRRPQQISDTISYGYF